MSCKGVGQQPWESPRSLSGRSPVGTRIIVWRGDSDGVVSLPHFHARYGPNQAVIGVEDLVVLKGDLPPRALGLVMEWAVRHRAELMEDWDLARAKAPLKSILPLE